MKLLRAIWRHGFARAAPGSDPHGLVLDWRHWLFLGPVLGYVAVRLVVG